MRRPVQSQVLKEVIRSVTETSLSMGEITAAHDVTASTVSLALLLQNTSPGPVTSPACSISLATVVDFCCLA